MIKLRPVFFRLYGETVEKPVYGRRKDKADIGDENDTTE